MFYYISGFLRRARSDITKLPTQAILDLAVVLVRGSKQLFLDKTPRRQSLNVGVRLKQTTLQGKGHGYMLPIVPLPWPVTGPMLGRLLRA